MICIKKNKLRYLQTEIQKRSYSSAGSEHLPYKQGVLGSNPSGTTETTSNEVVFLFSDKVGGTNGGFRRNENLKTKKIEL